MGLLDNAMNKISYMINQSVSDPKADEYARQKKIQDEQDAEVAKRKAAQKAKDDAAAAAKTTSEAAAASLVTRSKFNLGGVIRKSAQGSLLLIFILGAILFATYGGHLLANQSIGWSSPVRILMFFYGCLGSFYLVPKSLYDVYWLGNTLPYYTFLPLSTYLPQGDLQRIILGPFCYVDDASVQKARADVKALYEKGATFTKIAWNK